MWVETALCAVVHVRCACTPCWRLKQAARAAGVAAGRGPSGGRQHGCKGREATAYALCPAHIWGQEGQQREGSDSLSQAQGCMWGHTSRAPLSNGSPRCCLQMSEPTKGNRKRQLKTSAAATTLPSALQVTAAACYRAARPSAKWRVERAAHANWAPRHSPSRGPRHEPGPRRRAACQQRARAAGRGEPALLGAPRPPPPSSCLAAA